MSSPSQFNQALVNWNGLHGLPRFDAVADGDFAAAFESALASHEREIDAIAGNKEEPSFDNTVVALEIAGDELSRVSALFLESGRRPYQRRHPGAGAGYFAEDVAALFEDRHECGSLQAH